METKIKEKDDLEMNDNFNSSLKQQFMVDGTDLPSPFKYKEPMEAKMKKKEDLEIDDNYKDDDSTSKKKFMFWSTIKGYAGSSTIHGFSYLVEDGRSLFEK